MIDSQLRTSGVNDHGVLARMAAVPREDFVPAAAKGFAYMDRAISLENGRYLAPPLVQGMMLQEARPERSDKALLVDGGSGYLAELLRPLVGSLEVISPEDAAAAAGAQGDFSLLIVDGAIEQLPDSLVSRLADDGRVVTGWVRDGITRLATGRLAAGEVALLPLAEIGIPALPEFAKPKGWSF
ncbi:protein-L-isoaspartate O-methyltransferase [Altererythrobacter soli]|uniref:Protein-L-isoaspartate O-methyltransferase n=2 Tax=Croceibacterium soli TaxID=1739690 RepID=A0A6I4URG5_9SPHN|nr:protein-L-isoaspartate O-methyltransferase [Croceibacterium soli]